MFLSVLTLYAIGTFKIRKAENNGQQVSMLLKAAITGGPILALVSGIFLVGPKHREWEIMCIYRRHKNKLSEEYLKMAYSARLSMLFFKYD